jgi:hypothetical protein
MNLEQVLIADDKSEVTNFSGTILFVGKSETNESGKSKTRQTVSVGETQEKSIWITIWDGAYDIKVKGSKMIVEKATVEVYKGKRRLTTTAKSITITDIPTAKVEAPKEEPKPVPAEKVTGVVQTGSVEKPVAPIAPIALPDVKTQMDELLGYYEKLLTPRGYTSEDIRTIAATCFIEMRKVLRKERF